MKGNTKQQQRRLIEALVDRRDGVRVPKHRPVNRHAMKQDLRRGLADELATQ